MGASEKETIKLPVHRTQYLTFLTAGEEYAISIGKIREIIEYETVTTVPNTPAWISGVTNLRGKVIPVVESRHQVRIGGEPHLQVSCVIITDVMFQGRA